MAGRLTFSTGASTVAVPRSTSCPFWFTQWQSRTTRCFSGIFPVTVQVAVMVSPGETGARNLRSWPT